VLPDAGFKESSWARAKDRWARLAARAAHLPIGLSLIGSAWSEPTLIELAYAFEQLTKARIVPTFADNLPPEKVSFSSAKPAPRP
jgi:hypothetical protein